MTKNKIISKFNKETNIHQLNRLVAFMVKNPTFAKYAIVKNSRYKLMYNRLWKKLSVQLNMRGPPMRTTSMWKMVWVNYKKNLLQKCYFKQSMDRIRLAGGTGNYIEIKFSKNETAIKELIFNTSFGLSKCSNSISPNTYKVYKTGPTTCITYMQEEPLPPIKTEPCDIFTNVTDATKELQLVDNIYISPCSSLATPNLDTPVTISRSNLLEEHTKIKTLLSELKKEKLKISRQTAEIKQQDLELKEKLQELKEKTVELKRQQTQYKTEKFKLMEKEQMEKAAELKNSINFKFKKIS